MLVSEAIKNKTILIAEHDAKTAERISGILHSQGFDNLILATDGGRVYEILKSFHDRPDDLGVIIIDVNIPQCDVQELCRMFASREEDHAIPFVILREQSEISGEDNTVEQHCMLHSLNYRFKASELIAVISFFILLKNEQVIRCRQQEQLINELAERKVIDAKLKYLVSHDELTGLLNRVSLEQHLKLILEKNRLLQQHGALLYIDIDRFGIINDLEGFETGDRLILDIVMLIRQILHEDCLFARIGSDEFCIYIDNESDQQIKDIANRIRKELEAFRFQAGTVYYSISVSIGIASLLGSKLVTHPGNLISRAHQACHMAKANGRNLVWEYNAGDDAIKERHQDIYWVPLIRDALLNKKFFLVFQPVVNLQDGQIARYEVLIRMRGPQGNTIDPANFIPAAERMGLIHSIDLWVVEKAIDFLASLPDEMAHICLAVNLSSAAFQDPALLPTIRQKLEMTWLDAARITFEITETAAIGNFEQTRRMIGKIRSLGCHFALDDFGAGFCSFNYLKKFPVDYIKIDGQFIQNLVNDETDRVLVRSMCEIAKKLGKKTIAEYIENPRLIAVLREIGVNYGQGYVLGKPEEMLLQSDRVSIEKLLDRGR